MLSSGKIAFAIAFIIAFVIIMVLSYRKDRKLHRKEYKGSKWVLVGFFVFILVLFGIKYILKE